MNAYALFIPLILLGTIQCKEVEENHRYVPPEKIQITHLNDKYLYENEGKSIFEQYGTAIRWRWRDTFSETRDKFSAPINENLVIPLTQLLEYSWIDPYIMGAKNPEMGKEFMKASLPFEIVYVGTAPFGLNGKPGEAAHAVGASRIVFYDLNRYNPHSFSSNRAHCGVALHEFTHILENKYGTPTGFAEVPADYKSDASLVEAISSGSVSQYGATSQAEDLAELVANFLMTDSVEFNRHYLMLANCQSEEDRRALGDFLSQSISREVCESLNKGKRRISQKLYSVINYYKETMGIDLRKVRNSVQERIKYLQSHDNKIPKSDEKR